MEALNLVMELRELNRLSIHGCVVEGDSKVVISWGMGLGIGSWPLQSILYETRELVISLSTSLVHVSRCQNMLADSLANKGSFLNLCSVRILSRRVVSRASSP